MCQWGKGELSTRLCWLPACPRFVREPLKEYNFRWGQYESRYEEENTFVLVLVMCTLLTWSLCSSVETEASKCMLKIAHIPSNLTLSSVYLWSQRLSYDLITDLPENSWEFLVFLRQWVGQLRSSEVCLQRAKNRQRLTLSFQKITKKLMFLGRLWKLFMCEAKLFILLWFPVLFSVVRTFEQNRLFSNYFVLRSMRLIFTETCFHWK